MVSVAQGARDTSAVTRYTHNALGQRVFKTEPLYPTPGLWGTELQAFFAKGWTPQGVPTEQVGWAYAYDEQGTLLGEWGMGGAQSANTKQYVYLPTPGGPLPVAMLDASSRWAIQADHLNTPRRLTRMDGSVQWQWALSAFGQDAPTIAGKRFVVGAPTSPSDFSFDLRYPGQSDDRESGLSYNYFRSYDPQAGRYTQSDPIGLEGGWNRFSYVGGKPLSFADPTGLCPMCLIPALPYVGEVAIIAAAWWASQNTIQTKTPNRGKPGEWHTNPGSGQERLYGSDGRPAGDIDWDHDHGQGKPHPHNWGPNGREVPEGGFSPWPRGRENPAQCK